MRRKFDNPLVKELKVGPVRMCVVGAGRAGMVHARNYHESVRDAVVVAVVDADLGLARKAGGELGVDACFASIQQALKGVDCDAVCITTPTFTHAEIAVTAAQAGKHVFCEKPMALTLEEAQAMIDAAREARVKLQIGFMRRFDPGFVAAKQKLQEGAIGELMTIKSVGRGPGLPPRWACNPKTSNGMLAEVNSHDFDSIRWLAGSEYHRVYAEAGTFKARELQAEFPDFYDNAVVSMRLRNGVMALLDGACPASYGYDARVEILGSEGVMQIGDIAPVTVSTCTKATGVVSAPYASWRDRFREGYIAEDRHFVHCILSGDEPAVTGEDGRRAVEIVLAANRSIQTGLPVVLAQD